MDFRAEHFFTAGSFAVLSALGDPEFHRTLALPDLSRPEVVRHDVAASAVTLHLRYEYTGQLDPIARRLLGARRLTWSQTVVVHPSEGSGTLTFGADAEPDRLFGEATITIRGDAAGCTRVIEGRLSVKVPVVGATAERRIVPGLLRRLDVEAAELTAHLGAV